MVLISRAGRMSKEVVEKQSLEREERERERERERETDRQTEIEVGERE